MVINGQRGTLRTDTLQEEKSCKVDMKHVCIKMLCVYNLRFLFASEHNRRKVVGFVKLIRSSKYILVHSDFHYSRVNVGENHKINTRNEENELKVVENYISLLDVA